MSRLHQALGSLLVAARNVDVRRAELAWGATMSAEWAHFVALGVFAYDHGGSTAVGIAGLVRLLPAAVIAPFASSLGDRFRRERFLLGVALLGSCGSRRLGRGSLLDDRIVVFAAAAAVGVCSTLFRPALVALLPSLARTREGADRGERSDLDDREPRHPARTARRRRAGRRSPTWPRSSRSAPWLCSPEPLSWPGCRFGVASPTLSSGAGLEVWQGFKAIAEVPPARLLVGLIASQTFIRGCLNVLLVVTAYQVLDRGRLRRGIPHRRHRGRRPGRRARGRVSFAACGSRRPLRWALVFWGVPIMLIAPLPYPAPVVVLLAAIGAANSVVDVAGFTLLQRTVPDEVLTRVLGVTWGLAMGAVAVGSFVAPAILSLIGLRPTFVVVGAVLPVLVLLTHRRLRQIDSEVAPATELAPDRRRRALRAAFTRREGANRRPSHAGRRRRRRGRDPHGRDSATASTSSAAAR